MVQLNCSPEVVLKSPSAVMQYSRRVESWQNSDKNVQWNSTYCLLFLYICIYAGLLYKKKLSFIKNVTDCFISLFRQVSLLLVALPWALELTLGGLFECLLSTVEFLVTNLLQVIILVWILLVYVLSCLNLSWNIFVATFWFCKCILN